MSHCASEIINRPTNFIFSFFDLLFWLLVLQWSLLFFLLSPFILKYSVFMVDHLLVFCSPFVPVTLSFLYAFRSPSSSRTGLLSGTHFPSPPIIQASHRQMYLHPEMLFFPLQNLRHSHKTCLTTNITKTPLY